MHANQCWGKLLLKEKHIYSCTGDACLNLTETKDTEASSTVLFLNLIGSHFVHMFEL